MKTALTTVALALAAVPSALIAQNTKVGIGFATVSQNNRIEVAEIMPGSTAASMGVQVGDVITHVGGKKITPTRVAAYIRSLKVGDTFEMTVKRKGETLQLRGTALARSW